jgi:hypothetical protein
MAGGLAGSMYTYSVIRNCYASGSISGNYVGGLVGYSTNGTIFNCFAFNPSITTTMMNECTRWIAGMTATTGGPNPGFLQHNYAICIPQNGDKNSFRRQGGHNTGCGALITYEQATLQSTYTTAPHSWDFSNTWTFNYQNSNVVTTAGIETNLPVLQAFSTTAPVASIRSGLQSPHIDSLDCPVYLNLTVFLQGMRASTGDTMTTYGQWGGYLFKQPHLPNLDPYGLRTVPYSQITNSLASTGKVVDWVTVELWTDVNKDSLTYNLFWKQALLLKTNGTIVDTNGNLPVFPELTDTIYIVVKHRNHLAVMSNLRDLCNTTSIPFAINFDTLHYNFTTANQAYKLNSTDQPMIQKGTRWCMYAGDIDGNHEINALDMNALILDFNAGGNIVNTYRLTDVTLDGVVNATDARIVQQNVRKNAASPVRLFQRQ